MKTTQARIDAAYPGGGYELVDYHGNKSKAVVLCPDHGAFSTTPDALIYTAGCPECRKSHDRGYPSSKRLKRGRTLYILSAPGLIKVGTTHGNPALRCAKVNAASSLQFSVAYSVVLPSVMAARHIESGIKYLFPRAELPAGEYMRDGATEIIDEKYFDKVKKMLESCENI